MRDDSDSRSEALIRVAEWYHRNGFRTATNDGIRSAFALDRDRRLLRPQLSVFEGQTLVRVIEVETSTSLGPVAVSRWREAALSGMPVYVYVPEADYGTAWQLRMEARLLEIQLQSYDNEPNTMSRSLAGSLLART